MAIVARQFRWIDLAVLGVSSLLGLSVVAMLGLHIATAPDPFVIAFELVVLLCAALGVLLGTGRFRDGPSLALACIAAITAVASLLAFIASNRMIGTHSLVPYLAARVALAGVLGLLGAWLILSRRPRQAASSLVRGFGAGVAFAALAMAAYVWGGKLSGLSPALLVPLILVAATVALGLLAASVHFIIRAFEFGHAAGTQPAPTSST